MASAGAARKLRLRLTLEGVEVPVVGAQIRAAVGGPAAAQIQIVPTDRAMEILPRTRVHLFYREDALLGFESLTDEGDSLIDASSTPSPAYRTGFVGQVVGYHFSKSPGSRTLVLQCLDDSVEWDMTYQYMFDIDQLGSAAETEARYAGAETSTFDRMGLGGDVVSQAAQLLQQQPKTDGLTEVTGLLGGLISLLEAVGGVPGQTRGANDYTTIAELMVKNLHQIMAEEADNSAASMINTDSLHYWLLNQLQQLGGRITVRDIIRLVNSYIYYDTAPNPFPYYTVGDSIAYARGAGELRSPLSSYVVTSEFGGRTHPVTGAKENPHYGIDLVAAAGTPIYPIAAGEVTEVTYNEIGGNSIRIDHGDGLQSRYLHLREPSPFVPGDFVTQDDTIGEVGATGRVTGPHLHMEVKRNGVLVNPRDEVDFTATEARTPAELTAKDRRRSARIATQIFRPDVWFVAPPRCNVFFPEMYSRLSMGRTFTQETSRYYLQVANQFTTPQGSAGEGYQSNYYHAPYSREMQNLIDNDGFKDGRILSHEKFTGVIPDHAWYASGRFFLSEENQAPSGLENEEKGYLKYISNFNFFKSRLMQRSLSIGAGPFNPFPVVGFPGLVIQRGMPPLAGKSTSDILQLINDKDPVIDTGFDLGGGKVFLPTQYLGMVVAVQHSLTQDGGTTSVTLNHARVHRAAGGGADDEFLNLMINSRGTDTTGVVSRTVYHAGENLRARDFETLEIVAALTPQDTVVVSDSGTDVHKAVPRRVPERGTTALQVGDTGPNGGTIESIETSGIFVRPDVDITASGSASPNPSSSAAVLRTGIARTLPGQGLNDDDRATRVVQEVNLYSEIVVLERMSASSDQATELDLVESPAPIESVLFPPWISSLYYNENIGNRIYRPFLGIGSIVDEQSIRERKSSSLGSGSATPGADARVEAGEVVVGGLTDTRGVGDLEGARLAAAAEDARVRRETSADGRFIDEAVAQQSLDVSSDDPTLDDYLEAKTSLDGANVSQTISIAQAVDTLSTIYGHLKAGSDLDVNRFVRRYAYRPVATMEEILGGGGFKFDANGEPETDFNGEVIGFEGFHSRAVAGLGDLKALVEDPTLELPSVSGKDPRRIDKTMDPRLERQARVQTYVSELLGLRGLTSRGLPG